MLSRTVELLRRTEVPQKCPYIYIYIYKDYIASSIYYPSSCKQVTYTQILLYLKGFVFSCISIGLCLGLQKSPHHIGATSILAGSWRCSRSTNRLKTKAISQNIWLSLSVTSSNAHTYSHSCLLCVYFIYTLFCIYIIYMSTIKNRFFQ